MDNKLRVIINVYLYKKNYIKQNESNRTKMCI